MRNHSVQHSTWVIVDLQAIKNNVRNVIELSGTAVMAVVKARAYGHGAVMVAKAALEAGASWCGVGRLSEALELRQAGLDCRILLLGYTPEGRYAEAISHDVSMTVWDSEQLELVSAEAVGLGKTAGGEGLLGLQRAFQVSGARTVVASLWKVKDLPTRDLMERFYENMWDKDMGKLEALREAQLWMLRERGTRGLDEFDDEKEPPKRLPPYYAAPPSSGSRKASTR